MEQQANTLIFDKKFRYFILIEEGNMESHYSSCRRATLNIKLIVFLKKSSVIIT